MRKGVVVLAGDKSAVSKLFKSVFPSADNFRLMLHMADDDTAFEMACAFLFAARTSESILRDGWCPVCYLSGRCAGNGILQKTALNRLAHAANHTQLWGPDDPIPPPELPFCPYYATVQEGFGRELSWCLTTCRLPGRTSSSPTKRETPQKWRPPGRWMP